VQGDLKRCPDVGTFVLQLFIAPLSRKRLGSLFSRESVNKHTSCFN